MRWLPIIARPLRAKERPHQFRILGAWAAEAVRAAKPADAVRCGAASWPVALRQAGAASPNRARTANVSPRTFLPPTLLVEPPNEPEALTRIANLIRQQNATLCALIRHGIDEAALDGEFDPELASTVLWTAMNGVLSLMWRTDSLRADAAQVDAMVGMLVKILSNGLKKRRA